MKDRVIKKVLNEKRPVVGIFLAVSSICLLVIPVFSILMMTDATFKENIDVIKETFLFFGCIGMFGLGITIYLMKFTNKLNVIKITKEELEMLYDQYIDDKRIKYIETQSLSARKQYERVKKSSHAIIIPIIVILISIFIAFIFNWSEFIIWVFAISVMVSLIYLFYSIEIALKPIEKLIEEFKEKYIIDFFSSKIANRNKEIIKENKNKEVKRKNPILFWLIEIFLLIWCLAAFNKETLSLIETDGVYGFIAIIIIFGLPAFFFIRNIYKRYFKESK